jgi:hypothetical protein
MMLSKFQRKKKKSEILCQFIISKHLSHFNYIFGWKEKRHGKKQTNAIIIIRLKIPLPQYFNFTNNN